MSANSSFNYWRTKLPPDQPFRVSAVMMSGKYKYVTFTRPSQFKTWLTNNYYRIHTIVSVK